jgi:hypothetical protein
VPLQSVAPGAGGSPDARRGAQPHGFGRAASVARHGAVLHQRTVGAERATTLATAERTPVGGLPMASVPAMLVPSALRHERPVALAAFPLRVVVRRLPVARVPAVLVPSALRHERPIALAAFPLRIFTPKPHLSREGAGWGGKGTLGLDDGLEHADAVGDLPPLDRGGRRPAIPQEICDLIRGGAQSVPQINSSCEQQPQRPRVLTI